MAGLSINQRNQKDLQYTLGNAKKYCPEAAPLLKKVDFSFDAPVGGQGFTERNGERYSVKLSSNFHEKYLDEQLDTVCHEVAGHVNFLENNKEVVGNSKAEELFAYSKGEAAREKFTKGTGHAYKPHTQKELMELLNSDSGYKCLPEKPITSKLEAIMASFSSIYCKIKTYDKDIWSTGILKDKDQK